MPAPTVSSQKIAGLMPIITVAAGLLFLVAGYFLLLLPKIGPLLAGGRLDSGLLEAQLSERQAYLQKLQSSVSAFKDINAERKQRLQAVVPAGPDVPGIMVTLDAIGKESGFVMTSIDTVVDENTVTPGGSRLVRISVNMAGGSYDQFKALLEDISRSLRLFDVQSVVFTPNSGNYALVMRAYYYQAEPAPGA